MLPGVTAPIAVLDVGVTVGDDGVAYPTVVLDVAARPDVADLARVHAIEGIGDVATSATLTGTGLVLTVRLTRPVRASFSIAFELPDHLEVLVHAALTGSLLLATTVPSPEGDDPAWLAVDLDGVRLAELLTGG
jgi:hypothetical protein